MVTTTMNTKEYDRSLKLARSQKTPTKRVYDLLLKADALGDARATYAIATWYLFGSPFTKINYRTAARMLKKAADENIAAAAYDLAVSYERGAGIGKSLPKAFEYYMRAALLGDAQAHFEVGRMYRYGLGVSRNRKLAGAWADKAEALG